MANELKEFEYPSLIPLNLSKFISNSFKKTCLSLVKTLNDQYSQFINDSKHFEEYLAVILPIDLPILLIYSRELKVRTGGCDLRPVSNV